MARLILTFRNKVVSNHLVSAGTDVIIGRDPNCQIVIDHPSVSSRHARVRQDDIGFQLSHGQKFDNPPFGFFHNLALMKFMRSQVFAFCIDFRYVG